MLRSFALMLVLGTTINVHCTSQELKSSPNSQKTTEVTQRQDTSTPTVKKAVATAPQSATKSESSATASTENLPACVQKNCNCSDFSPRKQAQAVLDAFPDDPHGLDRNKDGVACESLPD
jgi:hypothetical protein